MARSKKKTLAQHIVGTAAIATPAPVRDVVSSRWGARLTLLSAAALSASGIITFTWTDGKPHVEVNKERAREVEQNLEAFAEQRVEKFREEHGEKPPLTERWSLRNK